MKLWATVCRATQDAQVMVESTDKSSIKKQNKEQRSVAACLQERQSLQLESKQIHYENKILKHNKIQIH